jgi:nitrate/nitrite transporter NarK
MEYDRKLKQKYFNKRVNAAKEGYIENQDSWTLILFLTVCIGAFTGISTALGEI